MKSMLGISITGLLFIRSLYQTTIIIMSNIYLLVLVDLVLILLPLFLCCSIRKTTLHNCHNFYENDYCNYFLRIQKKSLKFKFMI